MMRSRGMVRGRKRPWGDQLGYGPPTFPGSKSPRFDCPREDKLDMFDRQQMALAMFRRRIAMKEEAKVMLDLDLRSPRDRLEFCEREFLWPRRPLRRPEPVGPLEPLRPPRHMEAYGPPEPFDSLRGQGPLEPYEPSASPEPVDPLGHQETFNSLGPRKPFDPSGLLVPRRGHRGTFHENYDFDVMRKYFEEDGIEMNRGMGPGGFRGRGFHRVVPDFQDRIGGRRGDKFGGLDEEMGDLDEGLGGGHFCEFGKLESLHGSGRGKDERRSDSGREQEWEASSKKVGKLKGSFGDKSERNNSRQWATLFGDSTTEFPDMFIKEKANESEGKKLDVEPGNNDGKAVKADDGKTAAGKVTANGRKAVNAAQRNQCAYGDRSEGNNQRRWDMLPGDRVPKFSAIYGEKKADQNGKAAGVDRPQAQNDESKQGENRWGWQSGKGSCELGGRSGNHGGFGGDRNHGVFGGGGNRGGLGRSGNHGAFGGNGKQVNSGGNVDGFGEDDIGCLGTGASIGGTEISNVKKERKGKSNTTPINFFNEKHSCTYGSKSDNNSRRRWANLSGGEPNHLDETPHSRFVPHKLEEKVGKNTDFDEKMKRLKATIPLQSLMDRAKMMKEKLVTVEDFRNLVGNFKNIKASCYFVRFTDPTDPSVRVIECQLYMDNVFMSSAKTKIARSSMLDLCEPEWKRSPEKRDVINDTYIRAWETFNSKTVNDICMSHRILRDGEVPEGTFSYVGHGDGKFSPTNIASLVRMKHPYKPSTGSSLSDLILMSSDDATSSQILRRSCNHSGLLMEMDVQLKQFITTNTIICKLFIAKKFIAQGKGGNKDAAWSDCCNTALEKLKKTASFIKIKPNTSKEHFISWEVFKAKAESWYAAQGLPDPTPDQPRPTPDASVTEDVSQMSPGVFPVNPNKCEPSSDNIISDASRNGLEVGETTQPAENVVTATVSSTSSKGTTPGVEVYNAGVAGSNTAIQPYSQHSCGYANTSPQFSFVYDAQGYCYILDSTGQYRPYTAQAHAMYYNMCSGQYGQTSAGQYAVRGGESYPTQTFGQWGSMDDNANPWGGFGQTPFTQVQTTTTQPPADPTKIGHWEQSEKVSSELSEAKVSPNHKKCQETKGLFKSDRLLSSGVLVQPKGKFIHWREPLEPVNKKVLTYLEHKLKERQKVDSLDELYICNGMPLAERQALEDLCLKYDLKLIMHGANHKVSVIRFFSAQETFACLKRNNNASGRTVLVAENGVLTGLE